MSDIKKVRDMSDEELERFIDDYEEMSNFLKKLDKMSKARKAVKRLLHFSGSGFRDGKISNKKYRY